MRLNAIIRGSSYADLMAKATACCDQFYQGTPYDIILNVWDPAGAEYDSAGAVTGFQFSMVAEPKTQ